MTRRTFTLTFDMESDAFAENPSGEVAATLRNAAIAVERPGMMRAGIDDIMFGTVIAASQSSGVGVKDTNGNTIGRMEARVVSE